MSNNCRHLGTGIMTGRDKLLIAKGDRAVAEGRQSVTQVTPANNNFRRSKGMAGSAGRANTTSFVTQRLVGLLRHYIDVEPSPIISVADCDCVNGMAHVARRTLPKELR